MTTLQEAARKALEALESMRKIDTDEAIESLRTALAQQGEPVAWRVWSPDGVNVYQYVEDGDGDGDPLYTAAPAPQPTSADYAMGYAEGFNDACKPAPQPVQEVNLAQYSACSNNLRTLGKPYPRTCKLCGLGPCKNLVAAATPKDKP